ncbi:hypothetical protein RB195_014371 [Necator americanus]|uniref:Uncharacterized protein n=1 Tax=Necator americanus TaxID=51031 RepID=A0ABR1DZT8_NECAM
MKVLLVLEQIHEQRERRNLLFLSLPLVVISQQYSTQRANVDTVPAWYQGHPKQMNPGYGYERVQGASQANMNYHNYPTFGANRPAYPELTMGGVAPTRRYPVGGQDKPHQTSLSRYHQLLLRKQEKMRKEKLRRTIAEMRGALPQSLKNIYSTIRPIPQSTVSLPLDQTDFREKQSAKWRTSIPKRATTESEWMPPKETTTVIVPTIPRNVATTTLDRISCCVSSTSETTSAPKFSLMEYLWPNAELLAAIKDVVAKFKASLDETGIDQDVRLMGSQLRNTWQQLRTGPMNEQLVTKDHNLSLGLLKTALCTEAFSTYDCTPYVFISLFCPML